MKTANLKTKPSSCVFDADEIKFLGFQVSKLNVSD